jgi:hypothetical protein
MGKIIEVNEQFVKDRKTPFSNEQVLEGKAKRLPLFYGNDKSLTIPILGYQIPVTPIPVRV